jgi:hypothetical protein
MNYREAAEAVLKKSKRPMTTRELTEAAIGKGLLTPRGKTPEASMSAVLYTELRKNPDSPIQRQYEPGGNRARRDSVRWLYVE